MVGRYEMDDNSGFQGWIEDEKKTWIMFIRDDGSPVVYLNRDPKTGGVIT